jgi:hypothetical protein
MPGGEPMNSTGDEISDDELDECVGTIETTMNLICGGGDPYFVYDEEDPPEQPGKRIDLTKYNKWSVIGWAIIAVLLLADIIVSALF